MADEQNRADPGSGGVSTSARRSMGTIRDWVNTQIAAALQTNVARTWLFLNGSPVGARRKIDIQQAGATGEDHPELDLARVLLSAGGGGGGGSLVWIAAVDGDGTTSQLEFTSIPSTYEQLFLIGRAQHDGSGGSAIQALMLRMNGDTNAAHYGYNQLYADQNNPLQWDSFSDGGIWLGDVANTSNDGFGKTDLSAWIYDYKDLALGTAVSSHAIGRASASPFNWWSAGWWDQLDLVTSLQLYIGATTPGKLNSHTHFDLYGLTPVPPSSGGGESAIQFCVAYGTPILAGVLQEHEVISARTISSVQLIADVPCSLVLDIELCPSAAALPSFTSICGANKPVMAGVQYLSADLTGWSTALAAGNILRFRAEVADLLTRLTVVVT